MSTKAKLRAIGVLILLGNLWAIGRFDLGDMPTLLLTFGFAVAFELWIVRAADAEQADAKAEGHALKVLALAAACVFGVFLSAGAGADGRPEPIVDRRMILGCPSGYVDHPYDPKKCVLPIMAERALQRARER